eukprot:Selendium_serpulae@DN5697_c0_g1_i1.p1
MVQARRPWVGGNWKCNGDKATIATLATAFNAVDFDPKLMDVVICPTGIHYAETRTKMNEKIIVGFQNVNKAGNGAFTGETSVPILKDMGVNTTLIGHSERRTLYGETDCEVATKTELVLKEGLTAVVCIGEKLEEREGNKTTEVVTRQMKAVIPKIAADQWSRVVIAYEPVWAIGTGKVATPEQAQEAHKVIRDLLSKEVNADVAAKTRIVYGGSVTDGNCAELIKKDDVDGFLVGGAALKPTFTTIIQSCVAVSK